MNTKAEDPSATQPIAKNPAAFETPQGEKFRRRMLSPFWSKLFLIFKIPLAAIAGLRIEKIDMDGAVVSLPFGWRTQNPFRSIYFAALAMAAELSTGAIALWAITNSKQAISMLVVKMEAQFEKKAVSKVRFHCAGTKQVLDAIQKAIATNEGQEVRLESVGTMADGTVVARFYFTWSFKVKSKG